MVGYLNSSLKILIKINFKGVRIINSMDKLHIYSHMLCSVPFPYYKSQDLYMDFEKEQSMYYKGAGKVMFTTPFLMLGKVIFSDQVNVLEGYCKGNLNGSLSKIIDP